MEIQFYCGACDVACKSNSGLKKHLETRKHLIGVELFGSYYENNKEVILQKKAAYRENNRALVRQRVLNSQMKNIESKKYYCAVCDLACRDNYALKKHLDTLKHSYAWLNSLG